MRWLKLHRRLLGIVAALALVVVVAGFALTRGYLIHFVYDDQTISRDDFYRSAFDTSEKRMPMHCTSGAALGFVYLWEVHCYSTTAALDAYMQPQSGNS